MIRELEENLSGKRLVTGSVSVLDLLQLNEFAHDPRPHHDAYRPARFSTHCLLLIEVGEPDRMLKMPACANTVLLYQRFEFSRTTWGTPNIFTAIGTSAYLRFYRPRLHFRRILGIPKPYGFRRTTFHMPEAVFENIAQQNKLSLANNGAQSHRDFVLAVGRIQSDVRGIFVGPRGLA